MILSALLLLSLLAVSSEARNIAITADGIALATTANGGRSLISYDANEDSEAEHSFSSTLPNSVSGFDDVAIDPNALARDSTFAFAIDAGSGIVCSFDLSADTSSGVSLDLIGCSTQAVSSTPFVGIAAMGGTLVVSGGTGGMSVFTYDEDTGALSGTATIQNQRQGDVGYPDVTLITPEIAALSADARSGFGVAVTSIDMGSQSISRDRFYRTDNSIGFSFALQPANFPLTSSVYFDGDSGTNYLYVANGGLTVQNPLVDGEIAVNGVLVPTLVNSLPPRFEALTVDVNSDRAVVVVGGVLSSRRGRRSSSAYVVLDISDPLDPTFVKTEKIVRRRSGDERITGIASAGDSVLYVMQNSDSIGHDSLQTLHGDGDVKSFA